jgi:DNA invertase Pin-like site-specific DNA recombinase
MDTNRNEAEGFTVAARPIPVAQYVRKSTDHQKYSTENQSEANHAYAAVRGMEVVRTYSDDGISGLTFEKRDALKQLMLDVQSGYAAFEAILVYDVSRWGRYQDVDESAYYEFICRRAGFAVHYCAEQFENDGSPFAALIKGWKRAMAGEYSRELSVKVFAGQTRLARQGYMLGGFAGYGLRRLLVDQNGNPKCFLAYGECKSLASDRVLLVPGSPDEIATVRSIFSMFAQEKMHERRIADILNERGIMNGFGRPRRHNAIRRILCNEKYIGNNVWNRNSCKLQTAVRRNDPDLWVRAERALPAIVDRELFEAAQRIFLTRGKTTIAGRPRGLTNAEMLERLKGLHLRHGYMTRALIDTNRELPSAEAYFRRFGGLKEPFEWIGVSHRRAKGVTKSGRPRGLSNDEMLDVLRRLWREHGYLTEEIIRTSPVAPHTSAYFTRFGSLRRAYRLIGFVPDRERIRSPRIVRGVSDEVLLDSLRELLRRHGRLSKSIIDGSETGPSHGTLAYRFGGLLQAYQLIGYTSNWYGDRHVRPHPLSDEDMLDALRKLWREQGYLSHKLIRKVTSIPSPYEYCKRFGSLSQAYRLIGFTSRPGRRESASPADTVIPPRRV